MNRPCKLAAEEIESRLATMPGWTLKDATLGKSYRFASYLDGIAFVNAAAHAAERMNHHPDLLVLWRRVDVTLSTHSAGGITSLDFELAATLEAWRA